MNRSRRIVAVLAAVAWLPACWAESATLPFDAGVGPNPTLPAPHPTLIPTVRIAVAKPWTGDATPTAASGLMVNEFARDLDHPRWLYTLPNGDVLVAETNAPERPADSSGIRGWIMGLVMQRAGAGVASANRISLLRDTDGDGKADLHSVLLEHLNSPFGMALVGDRLFVANTDAIVEYPYMTGTTEIRHQGRKVADLPAGDLNHHWTKNVIASRDGKRLYATIGSNSNVAENGIDKESGRAAVVEVDLATGNSRIFATGLRNPNGLAWNPESGALWTTVNERDEIGSDLVPDYLTAVQEGQFYGWPYSYYGQHVDDRVQPARPDLVARAIVPDYALGTHTGSLGLAFYDAALLPARYRNGAFIGQHGSWNRNPPAGYRVIFVPFANGMPSGSPQEILTGFLDERGRARGRPVGVTVDGSGAVLVADDVGNRVWRVAPVPGSK